MLLKWRDSHNGFHRLTLFRPVETEEERTTDAACNENRLTFPERKDPNHALTFFQSVWVFVIQQTIYCMTQTLTPELLEQIVREVLQEFSCHDKRGRFTKCRPGTVYSVLGSNDRVGEEYKGRGTVTGKKKDGTYRLASKYGENSRNKDNASGRKVFDSGEELSNPKYYVGKRYKRKYPKNEGLNEVHTMLQQWLKNAGKAQSEEELNEDTECSQEVRRAYKKGQMDQTKRILQFIDQYEKAKSQK